MNQERQYSSIYFNNLDGDNNDVGDTKDQDKSFPDVKTQWISFKQHFFSSDLISKDGFSKANLSVTHDTSEHVIIKHMNANLQLARSSDGTFPLTFYFGPTVIKHLKLKATICKNK
jgi:YidC/Oxa1 family membrane protein insertase